MAASSGVWTLPLTGPVSLSTVFAAPCAPPCSSVGSLTHREACGHRGAACERLWYTACLAVLSSAVNFTGPPSSWLQSRESMSRRWLWNPEKQDPSPHLGSGFAHPPRRPLLLQGPWLSMHGQTCTRPRECGPAGCHQNHRPSPEGGGSPDLLARGFLGFSFSLWTGPCLRGSGQGQPSYAPPLHRDPQLCPGAFSAQAPFGVAREQVRGSGLAAPLPVRASVRPALRVLQFACGQCSHRFLPAATGFSVSAARRGDGERRLRGSPAPAARGADTVRRGNSLGHRGRHPLAPAPGFPPDP